MSSIHSQSKFKQAAALAIAAGAMWTANPTWAAPTVTLAAPASVTAGGVLQLTVLASGFTDLYAWQFDVTYNPAAYAGGAAAEGAFLSSAGSTFFDGGAVDNAAGTVSFVLGTLIGPGAGASGSGTLALLSFNVGTAYAGSTSFALANFSALDSTLATIDVTLQGATVAVVPEPSMLALSLTGLAAFGALSSLRRSRLRVSAPVV